MDHTIHNASELDQPRETFQNILIKDGESELIETKKSNLDHSNKRNKCTNKCGNENFCLNTDNEIICLLYIFIQVCINI